MKDLGKKEKIKIEGMRCLSCAMLIDGNLEDIEGVISASTSYARGECEIVYEHLRVNTKELLEIIRKAGYRPKLLERTRKV